MDVARRLLAGGAAGMCACTVVSVSWNHVWPDVSFVLFRRPATPCLSWCCMFHLTIACHMRIVNRMVCCQQAYPLDLLRTRLAAQTTSSYYSGITRSLATIVRDEGFGGLYRGLGATLIQV
jgi:Mitochondrial carrier protein